MLTSFFISLMVSLAVIYGNGQSLVKYRRLRRDCRVANICYLALGLVFAALPILADVWMEAEDSWWLSLLCLFVAAVETAAYLMAVMAESDDPKFWETQSQQPIVDEPYGPKVVTVTRTDGSIVSVPWTGRQ